MNAALNSPSTSSQNPKPKLLDQMCYVLRKLHYKKRTEEPPPCPLQRGNMSIGSKGEYVNWVKRFIYFHRMKHPHKPLLVLLYCAIFYGVVEISMRN